MNNLFNSKFSLNIFCLKWIGKQVLQLILIPFHVAGCKCCLVAALACSFSKSIRVSYMCKRYNSFLTWVSHLSSSADDLSSFPLAHTSIWCQGKAENSVHEIFIPERKSNQKPLCQQSDALTTAPRLSSYKVKTVKVFFVKW